MSFAQLAGMVFGRLTAVEAVGQRPRRWLCRCTCGRSVSVITSKLNNGHTKSCGCLQADATSDALTTHGMSNTQMYRVWQQMLRRCDLPTHEYYSYYGGRGIKVCDRWLDFSAYYADVGDPPFKGATLDRENNDGNYELSNIRWATRAQQSNNRRAYGTSARLHQGQS